jgi:FKBP-type peptidyl-prolyl cis-trans isomerase FklB
MRKPFFAAVLLAAGTMLVANGNAQQTPAAKTPPVPSTGAKEPAKTPAKSAEAAPAFKTRKEKFSYALGMNIGNGLGQNLKKQSVEFDPNLVANGLKDSLSGGKTLLTVDEAKAVLQEVQVEMQKEQQ